VTLTITDAEQMLDSVSRCECTTLSECASRLS